MKFTNLTLIKIVIINLFIIPSAHGQLARPENISRLEMNLEAGISFTNLRNDTLISNTNPSPYLSYSLHSRRSERIELVSDFSITRINRVDIPILIEKAELSSSNNKIYTPGTISLNQTLFGYSFHYAYHVIPDVFKLAGGIYVAVNTSLFTGGLKNAFNDDIQFLEQSIPTINGVRAKTGSAINVDDIKTNTYAFGPSFGATYMLTDLISLNAKYQLILSHYFDNSNNNPTVDASKASLINITIGYKINQNYYKNRF